VKFPGSGSKDFNWKKQNHCFHGGDRAREARAVFPDFKAV